MADPAYAAAAFLTQETDEAVDTPNALDPELYFTLRSVRETVLRLVQDRSRPIRDRLSLALYLLKGLRFINKNGQPLKMMKPLKLDPALLEQPLYH
jgi:hypothetical protein